LLILGSQDQRSGDFGSICRHTESLLGADKILKYRLFVWERMESLAFA
jgi:hypothetical protein